MRSTRFATCLRRHTPMIAPMLLCYEVPSVLRRKTRDGEIADAAAKLALADILRIVTLLPFDHVLTEWAMDIAAAAGQKAACDAQYLALAERTGADFRTADERFLREMRGRFAQMRWIGTYPLPPPGMTS